MRALCCCGVNDSDREAENKIKTKIVEVAVGKILLFLFLSLAPFIALGQIWIEHFNYTAGDTLKDETGWTLHSGGGGIPVLSGSLSYPGYMASEGNKVELYSGRGTDRGRNLDQNYSSGAIYCSFLMRVTGAPTAGGTYFLHFFQGTSGTFFGGSVWIKQGSDPSSTFRLGVNVRTTTANTVWYEYDLNFNTTYLVVVKYQFVSGSGNDVASLWVNPDLSGPEPSPNAQHTNTGGTTDLSNIGRVALRQASGIGRIEIDEIRVGRSWGDAPLPVQVSNVIAEALGRYIRIKIETQIENPEFLGFNVYRGRDEENFNLIASYENIEGLRSKKSGGFGSKYEFIDKDVNVAGDYYYKIEAVGLNEKRFVGDVLKVFFSPPTRYWLSQNYPNPFNPETLIEFEIPEDVHVLLIVYDVLGREVKRLVDRVMPAGYHKVSFNGVGIPSGVYYYKLIAGDFVDVKKMVLLK